MAKWLDDKGLEEDVVVSTRLRVARNITKYNFPSFLSIEESDKLTDELLDDLKDVLESRYEFHRIRNLEIRDQLVYIEEHLISPNLIENKDKSSFLLRDDERATIMINEEDHIRIQTLSPGLNLKEGWKLCSDIDDKLDEKLKYAYDEKLGYLTSCPTNVGTGLRASVMLHLPCIVMVGNINILIEGLRKIGLTARGLYGEGSEALGNLYQISNQTTLGESEEDIIEKLNRVVYQIVNRERGTRKYLKEKRILELEDKIFRSFGILKYSRILSSKEAMNHLSNIRLGWEMDLLDKGDLSDVMKLMIQIQPANIQKTFDRDMSEKERDITRARIVRDYILKLEG